MQNLVFSCLGRAWPEDPSAKDLDADKALPRRVWAQERARLLEMEPEAALKEVRRLVGELCKLEAPSGQVPRSKYLEVLTRRVNQICVACPLPSASFRGIWRTGPFIGKEWGTWLPNSSDDCSFPLDSSAGVCKLQFVPSIAGARPKIRLGTRGWAVFSTSGQNLDVHRQLWQDRWDCALPKWLHVHHCADGPQRKLDNRLQALELRDWESHGNEHGREGGKAGGKGRVCKRPAPTSKRLSQDDCSGLAASDSALLASSSSSVPSQQGGPSKRRRTL